MRYLCALITGALVLVAAGAGAAYSQQATTTQPSSATTADGSAACDVALPGGVKALWTRTAAGGQSVVTEPGSVPALIAHVGSDVYAIPRSAPSPANPVNPATYDVTAAVSNTCGIHTATTATIGMGAGADDSTHGPGSFRLADLTINVLGVTGKPDAVALVFLRNVDDYQLADELLAPDDGVVKLQVPVGDYAAAAYTFDPVDGDAADELSIDPDFAVTGGAPTVTLDAADATSEIAVPTAPQAASLTGATLGIGRGSTEYPTEDDYWIGLDLGSNYPADPLYLTPTKRVSHGNFSVDGLFELASPSTASTGYTYHVDEPFTAVPASWPTSVPASSFAAVTRDYYARGAGNTEYVLDGAVPRVFTGSDPSPIAAFDFDTVRLVTAPYTDTEYFTATPDVVWQSAVSDDLDFNELMLDSPHSYRFGGGTTESFHQGAEHPGAPLDTGGIATECPACSAEGALEFDLYPIADSNPGSFGDGNVAFTGGDYEDYGYRLLRDGTVESSSSTLFPSGIEVSGLPAGTASYQLVTTLARSVSDDPLSTSQSTDWTFTADPRGGSGIPANWDCVDGTRDCTPLPLIYATYAVSDPTLNNGLSTGPHTLSLTLTHQQFSAAPGISGASVAVSYDGGGTWTQAPVSGRGGRYTASFTIPAGATGLSLKIGGWDAAGDRIDQTVLNAYTIG